MRDVARRVAVAASLALLPASAALAQSTTRTQAVDRVIAIAEDQRRWDQDLKRALADADARVRARAALAVGRLQDSTTVPALLPLLGDADARVRYEAVFALGQIGHRSAREPLVARLAAADTTETELVAEALGKLGDPAATPRVAALLDHREARVRSEAAVALWRLADSTALDVLLEHHDDPDPEVRWRVLYALEKIVMPARVVLTAALHLEDPDWRVRAYAVRTIGRQNSSRGTAYVLQKVQDPEPAVVVNAIRALQSIADSSCALCGTDLARALAHADPYVRVTAAIALHDRFVRVAEDSLDRRTIDAALATRLEDPDAATRGACARALIARQGEDAFERVLPLLEDSSVVTRVAVIQGIGELPPATAAPLLEPLVRAGHPLLVRMTAAEALGTAHAREALPLLRAGLADTSLLFVASAAGALAELADTASVPLLARAYEARAGDADADARISIRDALRTLKGRAYADSLERRHPPRNAAPAAYAPGFEQPSPVRGAVLKTTAGEIEWAFYRDEAVQTVKNFVRLAERGYFDGLVVHRVVPNFVIQDGDPTGTGSGGPGYTIRCEYNHLRYDSGMVGMALSGKDTGGSQWFVTHSPQPHLNGRYTIFARVTRGLDVARRVVQGDRVIEVKLLR
jgi:HEAT repeat protein/cyclophilin family peptidyl-prolyl cis-trans isomerase